jgi:transposase
MRTQRFTPEFKEEAVRQASLSEKLKAQLARELGVRVAQLRTWRLEFEKDAVTGIAKPDRSAAEDLEQLRRENAKRLNSYLVDDQFHYFTTSETRADGNSV